MEKTSEPLEFELGSSLIKQKGTVSTEAANVDGVSSIDADLGLQDLKKLLNPEPPMC